MVEDSMRALLADTVLPNYLDLLPAPTIQANAVLLRKIGETAAVTFETNQEALNNPDDPAFKAIALLETKANLLMRGHRPTAVAL